MNHEKNLEVARRFYVAFDSGNPSSMDQIIAPNAIDHDGQTGDEPALSSMRGLVAAIAGGFSNYRHDVQFMLPSDDKVVIRWRFTGTHSGNFFGSPATSKKVVFHGHDIIKIKDGVITNVWHIEQLFHMFQQMQNN